MHIHFIGIGGSAMGSVATACAAAGHTITGSDTAIYPPMSDVLQGAGVSWYDGYDAEKLRELAPNLVVVGNAVSRGNPEVEFTLNARLPMTSMAGLVGSLFISRNSSIVCAGTHGKTTTSAMTAWILDQAGMKPGFLIGGVPRGFTSGCRPVPESVHDTFGGVFVVEGDEYDTAFFDKRSKFVHYRPTTVIVNNIEFDHADIFDSLADIQWSFRQLIRIVPSDGRIFVNADDKVAMETVLNDHTPVVSVGLSENADRRIVLTDSNEHATTWHISQGRTSLGPFTLHMAGEHNVRNASMAILQASPCRRQPWRSRPFNHPSVA
jgi:UDP-N-acetylmuramate: L-alanyl-gamma-D-glutamyl-meso-diaminopimelate ligase